MIYKKLKELYNVDTISQEKSWKKLVDILRDVAEDITIDFTGISVQEPWKYNSFTELLKNEHVYFSFTNNTELVNHIKMMCTLDGIDDTRVQNKYVEVPKVKTGAEKKVEMYGKIIKELLDIEGNTVIFKVNKKYDSMYNTNSLEYIVWALNETISEHSEITNILLDFERVSLIEKVLEVIADLIIDFKKRDIDMQINLTNDENIKQFGLYMYKVTNDAYTTQDKFNIMSKFLKQNGLDLPGLFIKYKKSKAVDNFGRHGKGEIIMSRVAILKGISIKNGSAVVIVDTYNGNTFYTKQQWMIEHDNEIPSKLNCERIEVPINELGFCNAFLGSSYHFMEPIQKDQSENRVVIYDIDDNGNNLRKSCTIPERMKIVFDDWGIKYNKELLDSYIETVNNKFNV